MTKVLITTSLQEEAIEKLKKFFEVEIKPGISRDEFLKIIPEFEILIVRSETKVTKEIIDAAKNLKIIARPGSGTDNIDIAEAEKRNIKIMTTPFSTSSSVAELVFSILLCLCRKIREADLSMKQGGWEKSSLMGHELNGKTLGIIGLGRIGKIAAKIAKGFEMKILGYDPFLAEKEFEKLEIIYEKNLHDLLKKSDFITIHVPKIKETESLITKKEFDLMKKNAILINCARGGIVNEKDLYGALTEGKIAGAGVDTWEIEPQAGSALQKLQNVIALPHLGASTYEGQLRSALDLIKQIFDLYGTC